MKKSILFLVFTGCYISALTQTIDQGWVMFLQGDYSKSLSSTGVSTNSIEKDGKYMDLGLSLGYITKGGFSIGAGIDYLWAKESQASTLAIDRYLQIELLDTKSNGIIPNVYVGYYYRIINEFYFNCNLKIGYGKISSEFEDEILSRALLYSDDDYPYLDEDGNSHVGTIVSNKYDFFSTGIYPQLNYFIKKHVGLCLILGGVEYNNIDWENSL